MRRAFAILLTGTLAAEAASGQSLVDKGLIVKTGDHGARHAPLEIAYSGPEIKTTVEVVDTVTGKRLPAQIRNGTLVFILDELGANAERKYAVEVLSEKREERVKLAAGSGAFLDVSIGDDFFTEFHYGSEHKKPFLWPILAEGDVSITRDWPMGEADQTTDHPHQKSLWTAYGDYNGSDIWAEGANSGFQRVRDVKGGRGDAYAWITFMCDWTDKDGKPILTERREYRFYNTPPAARLIDGYVTLIAAHGDVKFGDTKEGGLMSVRMRDSLREKGGTGVITTAAGAVGSAAAWGKPAAWCDYSGLIEGLGVRGLAILDHPGNLRHPTHWHVRDYGLMAANCFGYSHFTNGKENGDWLLKAGTEQRFVYRVYVHSGDVKEADVAGRFADFARPPSVAWVQ